MIKYSSGYSEDHDSLAQASSGTCPASPKSRLAAADRSAAKRSTPDLAIPTLTQTAGGRSSRTVDSAGVEGNDLLMSAYDDVAAGQESEEEEMTIVFQDPEDDYDSDYYYRTSYYSEGQRFI